MADAGRPLGHLENSESQLQNSGRASLVIPTPIGHRGASPPEAGKPPFLRRFFAKIGVEGHACRKIPSPKGLGAMPAKGVLQLPQPIYCYTQKLERAKGLEKQWPAYHNKMIPVMLPSWILFGGAKKWQFPKMSGIPFGIPFQCIQGIIRANIYKCIYL